MCNYDYILLEPVLSQTVSVTVADMVTIQWSVLTDGGLPMLRFLVDWLIPHRQLYRRIPGGTVDGKFAYLNVNLSKVVAGFNYHCHIRAVNFFGFVSNHVFFQLNSSKGSKIFSCCYKCTYKEMIGSVNCQDMSYA